MSDTNIKEPVDETGYRDAPTPRERTYAATMTRLMKIDEWAFREAPIVLNRPEGKGWMLDRTHVVQPALVHNEKVFYPMIVAIWIR